jgi:hypothetical protein
LLAIGADLLLLCDDASTSPVQKEAFTPMAASLDSLQEQASALSQHFRIGITRSQMKAARRGCFGGISVIGSSDDSIPAFGQSTMDPRSAHPVHFSEE